MELNDLLNDIEARAKAGSSAPGGHRISLEDVPALVKALRYALKHWGYGVEEEVTAILKGKTP